jgi:BolA family transcriptional regulator, general stress-responsive regulator
MSVREQLIAKLTRTFDPVRLDVVDESARHAGHAGARPEGETHFRVEVVSGAFEGLSRVARQRLIHEALAEELKTRVHALSLAALTPEEDAKGP